MRNFGTGWPSAGDLSLQVGRGGCHGWIGVSKAATAITCRNLGGWEEGEGNKSEKWKGAPGAPSWHPRSGAWPALQGLMQRQHLVAPQPAK